MVCWRRALIPKRDCTALSPETCDLGRGIRLKCRRRSQLGMYDEHNSDVANYASVTSNAYRILILLDHKLRRWFGGMLRMQHWHRGRVGAMATANRRWMVAIEFGTWRCGRIGGAAGSVTAGNGRFFDCSGAIRS